MANRVAASLRIIRKVLSTASTTKAVEAAPATPGVVWPDCTPICSSTSENSLICARLMAGSRLARRPWRSR